MSRPTVLIFHRPAQEGEPRLVHVLADVRGRLAGVQADALHRAGSGSVHVVGDVEGRHTFGEALAELAPAEGGLIVLGSGAVPLLSARDASRLVDVATSGQRRALTNNRYSSDICALGDATGLRDLPALPSDNSLPRWLEERAGFQVNELSGRARLGLDLDTPLDIALVALHRSCPSWLRRAADEAGLAVPRLTELRGLAADPHAELLIFGRSGSATLRWLERNVRCRVRFLAEERGLRASSPLAISAEYAPRMPGRPPRATIGRLLERDGPGALGAIVAELGEGAVLDTRVLLADRLGADEVNWPSPADRFASDLLRPAEIGHDWLRDLTGAAAVSPQPIVLGAHSLVGPGLPLLLGGERS